MNNDGGVIQPKMKKRIRFLVIVFLSVTVLSMFLLTGCRGRAAEFLEAEDLPGNEEGRKTDDRNPESVTPTEVYSANEEETGKIVQEPEAEIYVDVCGAVNRPGVYRLKAGSRVFQAIEAAGGFLEEAASDYVNQAQSVSDGQQIYVPDRQEATQLSIPAEEQKETKENNDKVNLNTADLQELMTLSGIGESRAMDIIAYRGEHGDFSAIEEIMNVQGIKEGTFEKIKEQIAVR